MPEEGNLSALSVVDGTFTMLECTRERSGSIARVEVRDEGNKLVCFGHHGDVLKLVKSSQGDSHTWRSLGDAFTLDLANGQHIVCNRVHL